MTAIHALAVGLSTIWQAGACASTAERIIEFTTEEGTWMSVDVSPDGRTVAFDLLGDLYLLPIAGGMAKAITSGTAYDQAPRFSPDGTRVAFVSDRSGIENLWVANVDGTAAHRVTRNDDPVKSKQSIRKPVWVGGEPVDRGVQPTISPDGRWLAYTRLHPEASTMELMLRDLQTKTTASLAQFSYPIPRLETADYLRFAFTPDSRALLLGAEGKIRRVDISTKEVSIIPFTAHVRARLAPLAHISSRLTDEREFTVRHPDPIQRSPDRSLLAFGALGKIWIAQVASPAQPRRLTAADVREFDPVFSPDGKWIAYVSGSDAAGGHLWKIPAQGGTPIRLTQEPGLYLRPLWLPDGSGLLLLKNHLDYRSAEIAYARSPHSYHAALSCSILGVGVQPDANGVYAQRVIQDIGYCNNVSRPPVLALDRDASRVFYTRWTDHASWEKSLLSTDLRTRQTQVHGRFSGSEPTQVALSPDGRELAIELNNDVYVMAFPQPSAEGAPPPLNLFDEIAAGRLRPVTREGGNAPMWSAGGRELHWTVGNRYESVSTASIKRGTALKDVRDLRVDLKVPRNLPQGSLLLRGARILTMAPSGAKIIESGDLLIDGRRITAIGPAGSVDVPSDTKVLDIRGKTLLPGFVALHEHFGGRWNPYIVPDRGWHLLAYLEYGVTTLRDPGASNAGLARYAEYIDAGQLLGPRMYSAVHVIEPENFGRIHSFDYARRIVRAQRSAGGTWVKQYTQPHRIQRQWLYRAGQEYGLNSTNEGGSQRLQDVIGMVLDGNSCFEHRSETWPLYRDVIQLIALSGTTYSIGPLDPRLVTIDAAIPQASWPPQMVDVWKKSDAEYLKDEERQRLRAIYEATALPAFARGAQEILRAGGHVAAGTDTPTVKLGLNVHAELWTLADNGLTPEEVLRVATWQGARALGLERDLGSIEVGKIADLLVLNSSPLENIRSTLDIHTVIKDGVLLEIQKEEK